MKQSRRMSLIESVSNILVGFGIAMVCNLTVLPLFGFNVTMLDSLGIGGIMTVVSIIRSYCMRRVYEALRIRGVN